MYGITEIPVFSFTRPGAPSVFSPAYQDGVREPLSTFYYYYYRRLSHMDLAILSCHSMRYYLVTLFLRMMLLQVTLFLAAAMLCSAVRMMMTFDVYLTHVGH